MKWRYISHASCVACALVLACRGAPAGRAPRETESPAAQARVSELRELVTGPAAAAVSSDGRLNVALGPGAGDPPQISEARARELAEAYTRTFPSQILSDLEREHGGRIALGTLHACPRAFYARSAYKPLPDEAPVGAKYAFGPWWLVAMCAPDGAPVLSIAITGYATTWKVDPAGKLRMTRGSEVGQTIFGIPRRLGSVPLMPEEAVTLAASATDRRVRDIPELIAPALGRGPGQGWPQHARWRVRLERSAIVRRAADGAAVATDEVFVGLGRLSSDPPMVSVAAARQPDGTDVQFVTSPPRLNAPGVARARGTPPVSAPVVATFRVPRAELPILFDSIVRPTYP